MLPAGCNAPAMRSASCGVISAAQAVLRTKMFPRRAGSETSERPTPFARARPWRTLYSHAERLALPIASTLDAPGPVTSGRDEKRTASGKPRMAILVFVFLESAHPGAGRGLVHQAPQSIWLRSRIKSGMNGWWWRSKRSCGPTLILGRAEGSAVETHGRKALPAQSPLAAIIGLHKLADIRPEGTRTC